MRIHQSLPFEIGQLAEAKSFKRGYRGAWFRCKIQGTLTRKGQIVYGLEYYDYPDEGEGSLDCVSSKDLRPSLDWSLELGWRVPMPQGSENGHLCARLIKPLQQAGSAPKSLVIVPDDDRHSNKAKPGSSLEVDKSASSEKPICSFQCGSKDLLKQSEDFSMKDMQQTESMDMESNRGGAGIGSPCADSRSSVSVREVSAGILGAMPTEERSCESGFCDKLLINETSPLNSTFV